MGAGGHTGEGGEVVVDRGQPLSQVLDFLGLDLVWEGLGNSPASDPQPSLDLPHLHLLRKDIGLAL